MGSFNKLSGGVAAFAVAGAALLAAPGVAQAQTAAAGLGAFSVPCDTVALTNAINDANGNGGAVLTLASNCDYDITSPATPADGLPIITGRVTITGGGPSTVIERSAVSLFRIFEVASGGHLILNHLTIQDGHTVLIGGGVLNNGTLTVSSAFLDSNTAGNGGALSNAAGATATIANTVIRDNTASSVGGGAIINFGMVTVTGSTLKGNDAPINGGAINTQASGTTVVNSSSIIQNTSGSLGGGISNLGTLRVTGTEIRLNTGSSGGGIATGNANVALLADAIQDNTPDNCSPLNTIPGCHG